MRPRPSVLPALAALALAGAALSSAPGRAQDAGAAEAPPADGREAAPPAAEERPPAEGSTDAPPEDEGSTGIPLLEGTARRPGPLAPAPTPEPAAPEPAAAPSGPAAATDPEEEDSEVIGMTQIGRRIEETFHRLQDIAPMLKRQRRIRGIRERLPAFIEEVEAMRHHPALEDLDALSPRRLLDLEQEWSRVSARVDQWEAVLEARLAQIAEAKVEMRRARQTWVRSRDAEREEPLPESLRERIELLIEAVDQVQRRLDLRFNEVLEVSGELSDEGLRVAAIEARIASARQKAREERERRDHEPLWTGGAALADARPEPGPGPILAEHVDSLGTFARRELLAIFLHVAAFLFLAGLLLYGRRGRGAVRPLEHAAPLRALRSRPIASGGLLALVLAPFLYPYVPSVVRGLLVLVAIPLVIRLSPYVLSRPRRRLLELLGLAALSIPIALGYAPGPIRRLGLLVLAIGGIVSAIRLYLDTRRARAGGQTVQRLHLLLPLAALPLLGAAWLDVVGSVERAAVWLDGTYTVIVMAVLIHTAVGLADALIAMAARHRYARTLRIFRTRRRQATKTLRLAVRLTGMLALIYATLVGFDVLDPLEVSVRHAMRESHEFGSIDLTVGDVVSFGVVIAGTFVVVRLVHFILSHELLPRFELGTGTEAAISLTVSYLLVALGVILAFGLAGVNPEQLALLGGALGVGIGFGLQNVVSNFVSGLILVAERPIKVGDVIEIGGDLVGQVQRIGIRSSTVRSLTGAEVIVPNSQLISGQLVNWTLTDARRRVDMSVGTGYQHDPTEVREVLERVLAAQPGILHDPPPEVLCEGFGDSSIDFVLRFWTHEYTQAIRLKSKLAERVYRALDERGIEIPFPQRDVHLRTVAERAGDPLDEAGKAAE